MRVLLLRTPTGSRYPRWGYLDRFAISPHMARAVFVVVAAQALAYAGTVVWSQFIPRRHVWPSEVTRPIPRPRPAVVPLPRFEAAGGRPTAPRPTPVEPVVTVTPDEDVPAYRVVDDDSLLRNELPDAGADPRGASGGGGDPVGGGAPGTGAGTRDDGVFTFPDLLANDFVAFEAAPQLVHIEEPEYPDMARDAGVEGQVLVLVLVGVDGTVERARLADAGVLMLNESALHAVTTAVFKPALQADRPVAAWIAVPIEFDLQR